MAVQVDGHEFETLRVLRTKEKTKAYYNQIAKFYDLLAERSEQPMRDEGLDRLGARPGERILEIGFGTGHCLTELARAVGPSGGVFGLDISHEMVRLAEELLEREGLSDRVHLSCGDAAQMPYEGHSLDGIFTSFTLELFDTPDIPIVLAECRRVLRPGGRLAVVGISREGERGPLTKAYEWTHRHFPGLVDCRPIHVRRALEAADFDIRDARIEPSWIPVEIVVGSNPTCEVDRYVRGMSATDFLWLFFMWALLQPALSKRCATSAPLFRAAHQDGQIGFLGYLSLGA